MHQNIPKMKLTTHMFIKHSQKKKKKKKEEEKEREEATKGSLKQ